MKNSQTNPIIKESRNFVQTISAQLTDERKEVKKLENLISSLHNSLSQSQQTVEKFKEKLAFVENHDNDTLTSTELVETVDFTESSPTNNTISENVNSDIDSKKIKSLTDELNLLKAKYEEVSTDLDMVIAEKNKFKNLWKSKKKENAKPALPHNVTKVRFIKECQEKIDKYDDLNSDLKLLEAEYKFLEQENETLVNRLAEKKNTLATATRNSAVNNVSASSSTHNYSMKKTASDKLRSSFNRCKYNKRNKKFANRAVPAFETTSSLNVTQFVFVPDGVFSKNSKKRLKDDDDNLKEGINRKYRSNSRPSKKPRFSSCNTSSKENKSPRHNSSPPSTVGNARGVTTQSLQAVTESTSSQISSSPPIHVKKQYGRMRRLHILQAVDNTWRKRHWRTHQTASPATKKLKTKN